MTDAELTARLRANIVAFKQFQASHGFLHSLSLPGLWAFAQPHFPQVLLQQQVFFQDDAALVAALPAIEDFYRRPSIPRWRVWVPPGSPAGEALSRAGYHREGSFPPMGLGLLDTPLTPPSISLKQFPSQEELIPLNDEAFGPGLGMEFQPWHRQSYPHVHVLGAHEGERLAVGGMAFDVEDTAGIYLVATATTARGKGLATELVRGLLIAARARGRTAAVLQSTDMGYGVYRRVGFRDPGAWTGWVRHLG